MTEQTPISINLMYYLSFCPQILEDPKYKCIEKIKTIGYTYMAASGLTPETSYANNLHVVALTEFALAMQEQLRSVNEHSFNNFKMRIGKLYSIHF